MAYADQSMSSRKVVAIGAVALLHAVLGYAFITGLAYNVVKKVAADLKTFDVQEEPPPPDEKPPPPPPEQKVEPPPMVTPPPIVSVPTAAPVVIQSVPVAPPVVIHETAPPAPPPPPKPSVAKRAVARGNPASWVTTEDYPSRALREGQEGVTGIGFDITADGRVQNCHTVSTSGFPELDDAACRNFTRRARYAPAQDADGNKIAENGMSQRIRWQIPKD